MEGRQVIDKQKWRANKGGLSEEQLMAEFEIQRALRPAPRAPRITEGVRRLAQGAHAAGSATRCGSMRPLAAACMARTATRACMCAARRGQARGIGHALRVSRTPTRTYLTRTRRGTTRSERGRCLDASVTCRATDARHSRVGCVGHVSRRTRRPRVPPLHAAARLRQSRRLGWGSCAHARRESLAGSPGVGGAAQSSMPGLAWPVLGRAVQHARRSVLARDGLDWRSVPV